MVAKKLCAVCLPSGHFSKQARQQRCSKYELTRHRAAVFSAYHINQPYYCYYMRFFCREVVESRATFFLRKTFVCVTSVPAFPQNFVIKTA